MGKRKKDQTFGFDRVFDENATQDDVYKATTRSLLDSVLDGYNATVFAYGATGCGKTHTITGTASQPGIIFLTMQELFDKIAERADEKHTEISLSYLEIYNETIKDLLQPGEGPKQGLMLREDANQAVSVAGLSSHHPKDVGEVMQMIVTGNAWRTVSPTEANATSSRSHAVLQINVAQKDRNADVNEPHTMATLSIIDLAGSERASVTKNRGDRLLEGANINKSLLALGSCINALCDVRKKNHIPYRNSKLTRLLKFSLGGNCKTVMIVCVSPSSAHFDETQNTLRYANRAKNIQTKVTRNVYNVNRHVKDFLIKIDEQMALINELRAQQKNSEGAAFAKFRKQSEKREIIAREGIARIRKAYESSLPERTERLHCMKGKHTIEKRITLLNSWIAAFNKVCEDREENDFPMNIITIKKTAEGMLNEFEISRQHFRQRLEKNNWERQMISSLENCINELIDADGTADSSEVASLEREVEMLKANFARDCINEVLAMDKDADSGLMQTLLNAHIDIITSLNDVLAMTQEEAVQHAKAVLKRLFNTASAAVSQAVKPDGSINLTQQFPPTKRGTPKKKKAVNINPYVDEEPTMTLSQPVFAAPLLPAPVMSSPLKASPKRKKVIIASGKKITLTPQKKSPRKRSVKWRDDTDSGAGLADFEKTPIKYESPIDSSSADNTGSFMLPPVPSRLVNESFPGDDIFRDPSTANDDGSSPLPKAPCPSMDLKNRGANRFQAGFLSKRNDSPPVPQSNLHSSDNDSPLRPINPSAAANRQSLEKKPDSVPSSNSSSPRQKLDENISQAEQAKIRAALRRSRGSSATSTSHPVSHSELVIRAARRRSPTAAASPPKEPLFSAGQARRMGREKEVVPSVSVLSPRTPGVGKRGSAEGGYRRTTISTSGQMSAVQAVRLGVQAGKTRDSMVQGKSTWR